MNSKVLLSTLLFFICLGTVNQLLADETKEDHSWVESNLPSTARYEIVQSSLSIKWTFLLDKKLGKIWQWVQAPDGGTVWQAMTIEDSRNDVNDDSLRYQISFSGIAAKATFLLDSKSGRCWQLASQTDSSGNEQDLWQLLIKN